MRRVAIFGNAGGGKSTLAARLSKITGLPWHSLDLVQFWPGGGRVPHDQFLAAHRELIQREAWIIDGFGCMASLEERIRAADTLVHVDLPLATHYRLVTKRLLKGLLVNPEGWPDGSPLWRSTLDSYRTIRLCRRHLTPRYRQLIASPPAGKEAYALRSLREARAFLSATSPGLARG